MAKLIKSRLLAVNRSKVMVLQNVGVSLRYTLPGGIKKRKETVRQALIRETKEEIELQLIDDQMTFFFSAVRRTERKNVHKNYFHVRLKPRTIEVLEKQKFNGVFWLHWKKAVRFMDKSDRLAVKAYFRNVRKQYKKQSKNDRTISPRIAL